MHFLYNIPWQKDPPPPCINKGDDLNNDMNTLHLIDMN